MVCVPPVPSIESIERLGNSILAWGFVWVKGHCNLRKHLYKAEMFKDEMICRQFLKELETVFRVTFNSKSLRRWIQSLAAEL